MGRLPGAGLIAAVALALAGGVAACGGDEEPAGRSDGAAGSSSADKPSKLIRPDPANAGKTIRIGSKSFTESVILSQVYGQALARAGYTVSYDVNTGYEVAATRAMQKGSIDAYPEYTGTALTALLGVDPKNVPKDETAAYELTRDRYAKKYGLVALPQTPFTNSNALGMTVETARRLGNPRTISDLRGKSLDLTLAASAECFERTDCALGFREVYGLRFKREIVIDVAKRHEVILEGRADLTVPFTTDGQIAANGEIVLADDKNLFPPYNVTFVVRQDKAAELGPELEMIVTAVQTGLTTPVMQELNSRADLDGRKPAAVAAGYLRDAGYVE